MHRVSIVVVWLASSSCQESRTTQEPAPPEERRPAPEPTVIAPPETRPEETPPAEEMLGEEDERFVETAALSGLREVILSRTAKDRVTRSDIEQLAERMMEDHQRIGDELRSMMAARRMDHLVPVETDVATRELEQELAKLAGKKLEKRYLELMLEDHRKAVDLFREHSKSGEDQALREWAGKTLTTLESHLEHVSLVEAGKAVPMEMRPPKVGRLSAPVSPTGGHAQ